MARTSWTKEIYDVDETFVWPLYPFQEVADAQMMVDYWMSKDWWKEMLPEKIVVRVRKAPSPSAEAGTSKKKWGYEIMTPMDCCTGGFLSHELAHLPTWKSKPKHGTLFLKTYLAILANTLRDSTFQGIKSELEARGVPTKW